MTDHNRFRVYAYVAEGRIIEPGTEGWMLFGDMYTKAPDGARYVVAENVLGEFLGWRLDKFTSMSYAMARDPLEPAEWEGPTGEAVAMKLVALYAR